MATAPHPADEAALESAVSTALWVWDTLALEIGEIALVTDGHPSSRLVALAGTWYGASPVFLLSDRDLPALPGVTLLPAAADADSSRDLTGRLRQRPGVAAVELSGRAPAVDLLLEAVPTWSRLMLAGPRVEPFTIDYYVNVHRKGLRLVSAALDAPRTQAVVREASRLERVRRLLGRPERRQACLRALGAQA
ncbi:MAG: hypothetical protein AB7Q16_14065 [Vicinamibacterales bacterium]